MKVRGLVLALLAGLATSCRASSPKSSATSTPSMNRSLRILVTNDDGVEAPGIDELARIVRGLPDTEVVVWAPASNKSGTGDVTSGVTLIGQESLTMGGQRARAVDGFPADAVLAGLDAEGPVDLVLSGINAGANLGPSRMRSGTVGAARTAVKNGVWALAVSVGSGGGRFGFGELAPAIREWFNRYVPWIHASAPPRLFSINAPTCVKGVLGPMVEVPPAVDFHDLTTRSVDCSSPTRISTATDDVQAYEAGRPSLTELSATTLQWVTRSD